MYVTPIRYWLGLVILGGLLPSNVCAAQPVQFIDGLWLSDDQVYQNETVRVYVALRNSAEVEITGTVDIRANDRLLGSRPITALPGRLIESWIDWTPNTTGTFTLTATLRDVTLEYPTGPESVPSHTATLTREAVAVTAPPPPPTTASETATVTEPTSRTPQWYQALQHEIEDTHRELQTYETLLEERRTPRQIREAASSTATTTPNTSAVTMLDETPTTTSLIGLAGSWLQQNLQTAQLWLIRSVRWLFGYPVAVQLLLLVGILWATYRTAQYFGRR